jgi:hypothetical protein
MAARVVGNPIPRAWLAVAALAVGASAAPQDAAPSEPEGAPPTIAVEHTVPDAARPVLTLRIAAPAGSATFLLLGEGAPAALLLPLPPPIENWIEVGFDVPAPLLGTPVTLRIVQLTPLFEAGAPPYEVRESESFEPLLPPVESETADAGDLAAFGTADDTAAGAAPSEPPPPGTTKSGESEDPLPDAATDSYGKNGGGSSFNKYPRPSQSGVMPVSPGGFHPRLLTTFFVITTHDQPSPVQGSGH